MSEWLYKLSLAVVGGTFSSIRFTVEAGYSVIEAIAGRKVGEYILPVSMIDKLGKTPNLIANP
jgi:hypothetical protein